MHLEHLARGNPCEVEKGHVRIRQVDSGYPWAAFDALARLNHNKAHIGVSEAGLQPWCNLSLV